MKNYKNFAKKLKNGQKKWANGQFCEKKVGIKITKNLCKNWQKRAKNGQKWLFLTKKGPFVGEN